MTGRISPLRHALFALTWIAIPASLLAQEPVLTYRVDLNDRTEDLFDVSLEISGLTEENAVYQFASTAPGTYQIMDIGRYVRDFQVFDDRGEEIPAEQISTNQWRISDAAGARLIRYRIAETWDTPVEEHPVYVMAGTSIEADHVLINPHAVFGYPTGLQDAALKLFLEYPEEWTVGTALDRDEDGAFLADDYDHFVDSPVLLGRLSTARLEVTDVPVEIFVYSASDSMSADQLLGAMRNMLEAAGEFLGQLPVDRYTFLYHFENKPQIIQGAWEHSFSSEYVFHDFPYSDHAGSFLTDIAAHEFFHVVTPLNIHSEIIEHFNFVTPVPSQHLWLYEGTTEWAAHTMQLRTGLKDLETYLAKVIEKMQRDAAFDPEYTLTDLALTSYTDEGQRQYANIYERGALVAGLLDIRLLELSNGTRGLQNVIRELMQMYGTDNAFPENEFFSVLTKMTYPEIGDFFGRYVRSAQPLPIREYFEKLGIHLIEDENGQPVRFEVDPNPTPHQLRLRTAWLALEPAA